MQMDARNPISHLSLFLSLSLSFSSEANSISKRASERGASYAIRFLCREENRFVEARLAVSCAPRRHIFLSTIHTRSADSPVRQIISRTHTIRWRLTRATFFDNRTAAAADLCRRRVLRDTAAGGRRSRPLRSPRSSSLFFFFLGRFSRLFCVYLRAVYGSR